MFLILCSSKQIQASIAQTLRRQAEALALGRRRTAPRQPTTFRRSSRTFRLRGRNRHTQDTGLAGSEEDDDDTNGNEGGKDSYSADERCTDVRPKRCKRQRFAAALTSSSNMDGGCDEIDDTEAGRDSRGASPARAGTPEVLVWGKGGTRSHTRYGSISGSNGKNARNSRLSKLIDYLRNLEDNDDETMGVSLPQFIALQIAVQAEELEILVKEQFSNSSARHRLTVDASSSADNLVPKMVVDPCKEEKKLQILDAQETLAGIHASSTARRGNLVRFISKNSSRSTDKSLHCPSAVDSSAGQLARQLGGTSEPCRMGPIVLKKASFGVAATCVLAVCGLKRTPFTVPRRSTEHPYGAPSSSAPIQHINGRQPSANNFQRASRPIARPFQPDPATSDHAPFDPPITNPPSIKPTPHSVLQLAISSTPSIQPEPASTKQHPSSQRRSPMTHPYPPTPAPHSVHGPSDARASESGVSSSPIRSLHRPKTHLHSSLRPALRQTRPPSPATHDHHVGYPTISPCDASSNPPPAVHGRKRKENKSESFNIMADNCMVEALARRRRHRGHRDVEGQTARKKANTARPGVA
ncbi:hypothetical protein ACLOJK_039298 [Asimina triloba]